MSTNPIFFSQHSMQRAGERQIGKEALRAATLFGDRFVQDDGCIVHLVTRRAAARITTDLGLRSGYVHDTLYGVYVVMKRSGAVVTCGRRFAGKRGHIRRS